MAIKIEKADSFEINGKTYTGSFPIFYSDVVCPTPENPVPETDDTEIITDIPEPSPPEPD